MVESLYWYDYETTGIDPVVDRPLQFAGVRTDLDLQELAEPQNFLCLPGADVIPHPEAMLVTGILMSDVVERGMSEREFIARVMQAFSVPKTCVAGFNNLRFDDEFTRQMAYRNFHDPYAREWRNGNSRWDVIDMFRAAYALRPEGFNWYEREPGVPGFRLEGLAKANGIEHEDAHDALADVRATIEITRLLRAAQPKLYDYLFALRGKQGVLEQLYPLGKQALVHVSSMYPAAGGCTAVVLPLCQHPVNNNGVICVDLSQSPQLLMSSNPRELARLLFSPIGSLEEGESHVALKTIHINKCPILAPLSTLDEPGARRLGIDMKLCAEHLEEIVRASGIVEKIQDAFTMNEYETPDDPDFQLYGSDFFSDTDRNVMQKLLESPPEQLAAYTGRFQDDRLDEMLFRFRARNHPDTLTPEERSRWDEYRWRKWREGEVLRQLESEIKVKSARADERSLAVLQDLSAYTARITQDMAAGESSGG